ncbi:MAG: hypothetical protein R3A51_11785 [Nannocystaceae bacterium]
MASLISLPRHSLPVAGSGRLALRHLPVALAVLAAVLAGACGDSNACGETECGTTTADGETTDGATAATTDPSVTSDGTGTATTSEQTTGPTTSPTSEPTDSSGPTDPSDTDPTDPTDPTTETTDDPPVCGDGVVAGDEECDDGPMNADDAACKSDCVAASCGDGIVWVGAEECDDGGPESLDGCEPDCRRTLQQIVAGELHACVLLGTGDVRCWGAGSDGQLGQVSLQNLGDDETPVEVPPIALGAPAVMITAGEFHNCALLDDGSVRCWGQNDRGQLGYGHDKNIGDNEAPDSQTALTFGDDPVVFIDAGVQHTCAVLESGALHCWGRNDQGQLGLGHKDDIGDDEPVDAMTEVDVGEDVTAVALGFRHTCARMVSGELRCWGDGSSGQLGSLSMADIGDNEVPGDEKPVVLGGLVESLAAEENHTCAVLEGGAVRCWGSGAFGQLGYGDTNTIGDDETPEAAGDVALDGLTRAITTSLHSCAALEDGALRCWGFNADGQLGLGHTMIIGDEPDEMPPTAVDVGGAVIGVASGGSHTCAITAASEVRCWGWNAQGQLGHGDTQSIGDGPDEMPPAPTIVY